MPCLVYTDLDRHRWKSSGWACQVHSSPKEEEERSIPGSFLLGDAVQTQFACPSRAVKEGKGSRCDLKPAEEMGTTCLPFPM